MARSIINIPMQRNAGALPASLALAVFGILTIILWYFTKDGSTMSTILMLAGISIVVLACMLYMLSPPRYLQSETADAIAVSNTLNVNRLLSMLLVESKGIYVPPDENGIMQVFIPIAKADDTDIGYLKSGNATFSVTANGVKGISLIPPGFEILRYAETIGMAFTRDNIDTEIKDALENGLELASSVKIKQEGDRVHVTLRSITDQDMCKRVRTDAPGVCEKIGCPICSSIACMIAQGTGNNVRIEKISVNDKTIDVTYELISNAVKPFGMIRTMR